MKDIHLSQLLYLGAQSQGRDIFLFENDKGSVFKKACERDTDDMYPVRAVQVVTRFMFETRFIF